jgi:hypothetical protein
VPCLATRPRGAAAFIEAYSEVTRTSRNTKEGYLDTSNTYVDMGHPVDDQSQGFKDGVAVARWVIQTLQERS